jgi:hypothetical protein
MTYESCHCGEPKLRAEGEANPKQSRFKQTWGIFVLLGLTFLSSDVIFKVKMSFICKIMKMNLLDSRKRVSYND